MPLFADLDSEIGANIGSKWKVWCEDFERYITDKAMASEEKKKKRALLFTKQAVELARFFDRYLIEGLWQSQSSMHTLSRKNTGCTKCTNFAKLPKEITKR